MTEKPKKPGHPGVESDRLSCSLLSSDFNTLAKDAKAKGYIDGRGIRWALYFAQWAKLIKSGIINIPKNSE